MSGLLDRVRGALVGLKMPRALEALDHTLHRLEQGEITALEAIDTLLSEEYSTRETRRIDVALKTARLVPIKTLEGFDFAFQPSIDRERVAALAQLDFIRRAEVVHFLGPPGTGKSHLATALGVAAVKAGRSVYRATLAELVEALSKAEREGRLIEKIRFYTRASLLIVDEIGYLPITQGGANLFFQLVNARYEKGAMILTSNRGFAEWVKSLEIQSWRPLCWIVSSITLSSCTSKEQATACVVMPISFQSMCVQMRPLRRPHLQSAEGAHPKSKMELPVYNPADNRDTKLGNLNLPVGVRPWSWTMVLLIFPSRAFKEEGHMTKRRHRRHSIPFKRMIVEAYFNGTALNALSVEYDLCRHLIRTWIEKYENGEFDAETEQSEQIPEYEARIAALERLVGRQALEIEFLKTARRRAPAKNKENSSIVTRPPASQSDEDVN